MCKGLGEVKPCLSSKTKCLYEEDVSSWDLQTDGKERERKMFQTVNQSPFYTRAVSPHLFELPTVEGDRLNPLLSLSYL